MPLRTVVFAFALLLNGFPVEAIPHPAAGSPAPGILLLDDFEIPGNWTGFQSERTIVHRGAAAGRWDNQIQRPRIQRNFTPSLDLSGFQSLSFWPTRRGPTERSSKSSWTPIIGRCGRVGLLSLSAGAELDGVAPVSHSSGRFSVSRNPRAGTTSTTSPFPQAAGSTSRLRIPY